MITPSSSITLAVIPDIIVISWRSTRFDGHSNDSRMAVEPRRTRVERRRIKSRIANRGCSQSCRYFFIVKRVTWLSFIESRCWVSGDRTTAHKGSNLARLMTSSLLNVTATVAKKAQSDRVRQWCGRGVRSFNVFLVYTMITNLRFYLSLSQAWTGHCAIVPWHRRPPSTNTGAPWPLQNFLIIMVTISVDRQHYR